ncbi:MAG: glyoxalase/bleomycin resistance protein/dioxygenase, partial [Thermoleophilia bacterium]|nr:glyoxalase/bleomycin resistance protein/dioxygenase [Thermoleophilia bacterium]
MEPRISLITLGVADVARATAFYEALGFTPSPTSPPEVTFFHASAMVLAVWGRDELAADSGTTAHPPGALTLAHNVRSPDEVDAVIEQARSAGATIVREGAPTDWG